MFKEIKAHNQTMRSILELDERLVDALFEPAVRAGVYIDLPWKNSSNINRVDSLIRQLEPLSEYYQDINPRLSAAIWGTWNTVSYFRQYRSLLSMLFESKTKNEKLFIAVRGLIATAAMHFFSGKSSTLTTSDLTKNFAAYQKNAEDAIHTFHELLGEP